MLSLKLREEFRGKKIKGTMVDFTNRQGTGALDKNAEDFLKITYPSVDLLKTIEALQIGKTRPVVIIGARGQGKSHLMAAVAHMFKDPNAASDWLELWSRQLNRSDLSKFRFSQDVEVITESLHQHNYTFLWDLLFDKHPAGQFYRGKWEGQGDFRTEVPGQAIIIEMLKQKPVVLILDEFQTWYEGLTNTKQHPRRNWAFNFIQMLSEISENNPELLTLVLSVREGDSDAAQQVYRINPVRVDFKGPEAKRDRQKLLLYRIFENRNQILDTDIENLISVHLNEYFRLFNIPSSEHEKHKDEFVGSWPFSPILLQLLDDQVLIATQTQETRDLLRILVDVFKDVGEYSPVITSADFSVMDDKNGVASLLDSVANQLHRDLRTKAIRNYEAVKEAIQGTGDHVPDLETILSSLWLRSLSLENIAGAKPAEIQLDITRTKPVDDNRFSAELEIIKENSFNIHHKSGRLVFLNEENPQAKLMAHAKNDKLFRDGQDVDYLAQEIRYVIGGSETISLNGRVIVLKKNWQSNPWIEVDERDRPENWDNKIPYLVVPRGDIKSKELGIWIKENLSKNRNAVRFILPKEGLEGVFYDKPLLVLARAVFLSREWKNQDSNYSILNVKFQKELRDQLKARFDRFAILDIWNFGHPENCVFEIAYHKAEGEKIIPAISEKIKADYFILEDFEDLIVEYSKRNASLAQVLEVLKEPMGGGKNCIPWLGENDFKEAVVHLCAKGKIEINLAGREILASRPGESEEFAWNRMKGKIGSGRILEQIILNVPDSTVSSGGGRVKEANTNEFTNTQDTNNNDNIDPGLTGGTISGGANPVNIFGNDSKNTGPKLEHFVEQTSPLTILGKLELWGIMPNTNTSNLTLTVDSLTGAQLIELLKKLPDGATYGLKLEKDE